MISSTSMRARTLLSELTELHSVRSFIIMTTALVLTVSCVLSTLCHIVRLGFDGRKCVEKEELLIVKKEFKNGNNR